MASTAEVDLLVNATRTLPRLERDLDRTLQAAQNNMDDLDVNAVLNSQRSLNNMDRDLSRIIRQADADADPVVIDAAIQQRETLRDLQEDLDEVINEINEGNRIDGVRLLANLDVPQSLANLHDDVVRVARAAQATAPDIDIDVDIDEERVSRLLLGLNRLTLAAGAAVPVLLRTTGAVVAMSTAAGAAAPLIASVATAVENILPAAAVATTGLTAVLLATNAVKLGMQGVGDAISAAFEPDADMKEVEKQLKILAPAAADTAREIIGLRKEFKALQQGVQQRLFSGLANEVKDLSTSVLPELQGALNRTATSLNGMAKGVSTAAQDLSEGGVLGQALGSANKGLENLVRLPGQVTTAFGELAAAAGPSFERLTGAFAKVADRVSEQLTKSFTSGGLEDAINNAVDLVAQLGRAFGDVFAGIGNIIAAVSTGGDGLFASFERVSKAFRELTADKGFQDGLRALSDVATTVSKTVLPLLAQALKIVARVLVTLSEPVQALVRTLGNSLGKVLDALGPVLQSLAEAFGKLLIALSPLITLAGELISGILPVLAPLFDALGLVLESLAPLVQAVADTLGSVLTPILAALPELLDAFLTPLVQLAQEIFPVIADQLIQMAPDFEKLGVALGDLLVALAPIILQFGEFIVQMDSELIPLITGALIGTLALLAKALTGIADVFTNFVIPSVQFWIDLLQGDFQNGNEDAWNNVFKLRDNVVNAFNTIVGTVVRKLSEYSKAIQDKVNTAADNFNTAVQGMVDDAVDYIGSLPGKAAASLEAQGNALYSAGVNLINGFIAGIQSKIASVTSVLQNLTDKIPDWKGPMDVDRKLLTPSGEAIMESLIAGFQRATPQVMAELGGITAQIPGAALPAFNPPTLDASISPVVYVSIGNEAVDQFVTTRSEAVYNRNARTAAQGVRI